MEVLKERDECGYGLKLYLVKDGLHKKVKASKIKTFGEALFLAPLDVHFAVTNQCNMNCDYCYAMDEKFLNHEDMTLDEIKQILNELNERNVFKISWSGGEPLVRKDFRDILIYADRCGFSQSIITNGKNINREWINVFKTLDIGIQLSLHYVGNEFWDKCSMLTSSGIDVILDIVMEPKLRGHVGQLVSMAEKAGITRIKFGPLIPVGKATADIELDEYKNILIQILGEIESARRSNMTLVTQFDRPHINKSTTTYLKREDLLCEGGRTLLYVDNNGDTYPCPLFKNFSNLNCGNILEKSLDEIWHGDVIKQYRKSCEKAKECNENSCICGAWCRGLTLAYTGKLDAPTPFCGIWNEVKK